MEVAGVARRHPLVALAALTWLIGQLAAGLGGSELSLGMGGLSGLAALAAVGSRLRHAPVRRRPGWALVGAALAPMALLAGNPRAVLAAGLVGCAGAAIVGGWPATRRDRARFLLDAGLAAGSAMWLASAAGLGQPILVAVPAATALVLLARTGYAGGRRFGVALPLAAALAALTAALSGVPAALALVPVLLTLAAAGRAAGNAGGRARARISEVTGVLATVGPFTLVLLLATWGLLTNHALAGAAGSTLPTVSLLALARFTVSRLDDLRSTRQLDAEVAVRTMVLVEQAQWFRALVQNASDVITVVDVDGLVRYQSPAVRSIFGHDPAGAVDQPFARLVPAADGARLEAVLADAARRPRSTLRIDCPIRHADGSWRDSETIIASLVDDPDIRGLVLNTRDVSERRRLEAELTRAAFSDPLTGLANRALFRERVEHALADRGRVPQEPVVVLFCDLDGFKAVNDAQGHAVGDQLLGLVADRLRHCVRPGDTVARLGGDEFAVLLTGGGAEEAALSVAGRLADVLAQPFLLDGREIYVGTSAGIASSRTGGDSADVLLRNADLAMYRAKAAPGTPYVCFEPAMHDALLVRVALQTDLRQALARGQFAVHFQPTVDLPTGRIVGVEALLRWYSPERGEVPTAEFVPLAESSGLIVAIGEWVLRESVRQAARWQRFADPGETFDVSVNISGRQLQPALVESVAAALQESGLPPTALVLEMTESTLMERTDETIGLLRSLKRLGVRLAIDDFGTGYSSLSYLARFPVDILKIDRSFVDRVASGGSEDPELARTIVSLGRSLGLTTVAEGIERGEQLAVLREMGCQLGQGFLFARPTPAAGIAELLALRVARPPALRLQAV